MKHVKTFIALMVTGMLGGMIQTQAQETDEARLGPPPGGRIHPKPPIETVLDTNGDGTISAAEIDSASSSLKSLDKNGDGQLTAAEIRPARPKG